MAREIHKCIGSYEDTHKDKMYYFVFSNLLDHYILEYDLTTDTESFESSRVFNPDWEQLKIKFSEFEFNSIIGKEKSWKKYIKTFFKIIINC